MIWALVLAAGESKRMGQTKQLLPFGEKTILETVIDHLMLSQVDKILVVLGSNREEIEHTINSLPVKSVYNPRFKEGMLSSVQKGFAYLPKEVEAVLVFLGDQPMVPSSCIDQILDAYRSSEKGIVLPVYQHRRGHPILIDIKYRQEISVLDPDIGLRELIHNHPEDILEVELETDSVLEDIDTPIDYSQKTKNK